MIIDTSYIDDAYAEAEMEREEHYYFNVAFGESRIVPRSPKIEPCCKIDDYPNRKRR